MSCMTRIVTAVVILGLSACADLTPAQKHWAEAGAAVLAVGAIAAYKADHGGDNRAADGGAITKPTVPCYPQPDGTCR